TTETGYRDEIWLKPDFSLIATPGRYQVAKERQQGGDRKSCPNPTCRSKRIRKQTTYTCMDCGTVFGTQITDYPDTDEEAQNQVDFTDDFAEINLIDKENQTIVS